MFVPPKSYNEMLPMLHKATFFITLIFCFVLVVFGYIPLIGINAKYIPPVKDYDTLIKWMLTFGIIPVVIAVVCTILSGALDLHNNVAKLLFIRKLWDKFLIIDPLARLAGVDRALNSEESFLVMNKLYYPEVNGLPDKHYVELFWNKVYYFWVFFEHTIIAILVSTVITACRVFSYLKVEGDISKLWYWVAFLLVLNAAIFLLSVRPRTKSQVRQISVDNIKKFFKDNHLE